MTLDVLKTRVRRSVIDELRDEASKRREALKSKLRSYVKGPVFDVAEDLDHTNALRIQQGGEAKEKGFQLVRIPYRFKIQEALGYADGTRRLVMYSYQLYREDGETQLLRFEFHPVTGAKGKWSSKHHMHVIQLSPPDLSLSKRLSGLHLPVGGFLEEPVAVEQVLIKVLEWCYQEFN
jgi:hypothetical protein